MVSQRSPLGFPSSPDLTSCLKENIFGWDGVSFDLLLIAWCFFRSYRIYWALWVFKKKCFLCCGWISVIQVVFQFCELTSWVVFDTLLLFLPGRAIQTLHSFALCTAFPESSMIRGFLLAPSGALIAIPIYYWPSTHFFRSHRSSTLDFHFLSHY